MMNLYGGAGLGPSGGGIGSGGGIDPMQLLAMLHGNAGGGGMPMPTGPMGAGGPTPMSNFIGAGNGPGMMPQRPMMPPVAANPAPQPMGPMAGNGSSGLLQLLAQLKGGQSGVAPVDPNQAFGAQPATGNMAGTNAGGVPSWLMGLLNGGGMGGGAPG